MSPTILDRQLIVNADDFGQSRGINDGIIQAYERGIVTSASLMVRWPSAREAAFYARAHPDLSLGLHLDCGEWTFQNDEWMHLYEVVDLDDAAAVAAEVDRQIDCFRRLAGKDPTHLDSHQHVHREEPVHSIVLGRAQELDIPLRDACACVTYCGNFYGQSGKGYPCPEAISIERLVTTLESLPPGLSELGCHPASVVDFEGMYRSERCEELSVLCDPVIREKLADLKIVLTSFHAVADARLVAI